MKRKKLLVLAFTYALPYHAARCARLAGYQVFILGKDLAAGLRHSWAIAGYRDMRWSPEHGSLEAAIDEIARSMAECGAEAVMPTDIVSTRLLVAIGDRLPQRSGIPADPWLFDTLNDKWRFFGLCRQVGVRTPHTRAYRDPHAVRHDVAGGALKLPFVVKPVNGLGGNGVHIIRDPADLDRVAEEDLRPLLVQDYIRGRDRDISIIARDGRIEAHAVQTQRRGRFDFTDSAELLAMVRSICAHTGLTGVAHFDAVEEAETGNFYLLECNPRYWASIYVLAAVGVNMVGLSLDAPGAGRSTRPKYRHASIGGGLLKGLIRRPWRRPYWWMLAYYASDLPGTICDRWKLFDDNHSRSGGIKDQMRELAMLVESGHAVAERV